MKGHQSNEEFVVNESMNKTAETLCEYERQQSAPGILSSVLSEDKNKEDENIICKPIEIDLSSSGTNYSETQQQSDPVALSEGFNKNTTSDCSIKNEDIIIVHSPVDFGDKVEDELKVEAIEKSKVSLEVKVKIEVPPTSIDAIDEAILPEVETKTAVELQENELKSEAIPSDVEEKLEIETKELPVEPKSPEILEELPEVEEKKEMQVVTKTIKILDDVIDETKEETKVLSEDSPKPIIKETPKIKKNNSKCPEKPKRKSHVEISSYQSKESPLSSDSILLETDIRKNNVFNLINRFENWANKSRQSYK